MSLEEAIRDRILAISSVTASVGSRVYQLVLQQNWISPAIRVQVIGGHRHRQHLRGSEGNARTRVQVDTYVRAASAGDPFETARTIADAVRGDGSGADATGLFGWIGEAVGDSPAISIVNVELPYDGAPEYDSAERREVRVRQDYLVHWRYVT